MIAAVFLASVGATVWFWHAMPADMDMKMPGGWTMSMMWMVMPNQSWLQAALIFLAMWEAMMVAMMLPSSVPMLLLYRRAILFRGDPWPGLATAAMGAGYFAIWLAAGLAAYAIGLGVSSLAMHSERVSRAIPAAGALALIICGTFQLTAWKKACLKHCRDPLFMVACHAGKGARGAWRLGLHHGLFCLACCWALMAIQLVLGIMSLGVMVLIAVAIAIEKMAPRGDLIARVIGVLSILGGAMLLIRSLQFP